MKTAIYEGQRVQVVGETIPMTLINGKWHITSDERLAMIKFEGDKGFYSALVDKDELSDYQEIESETA